MNLEFISFSSPLLLLHSHFFHHSLTFQANIKSYPFCLKMSPKRDHLHPGSTRPGPSIITPWEIKAGIPSVDADRGWAFLASPSPGSALSRLFFPLQPMGGARGRRLESWVEAEAGVFLRFSPPSGLPWWLRR